MSFPGSWCTCSVVFSTDTGYSFVPTCLLLYMFVFVALFSQQNGNKTNISTWHEFCMEKYFSKNKISFWWVRNEHQQVKVQLTCSYSFTTCRVGIWPSVGMNNVHSSVTSPTLLANLTSAASIYMCRMVHENVRMVAKEQANRNAMISSQNVVTSLSLWREVAKLSGEAERSKVHFWDDITWCKQM